MEKNKSILKFMDVPEYEISEDKLKQDFVDHLNELKSMDVREQTLFQKWNEVVYSYRWASHKLGNRKAEIWRPTDITNKEQTIDEIKNLQPRLRLISPDNTDDVERWTLYRVFVSSFNFDQSPGRFLRFFLEDANTKQILGITSIASDVISIACRDNYIGWTDKQRAAGMLNHTAIGSTIVATQPFGYNFLGGKLLAAMITTDVVRKAWGEKYGDVLAGLTTTSLYGDGSMYNSIPWWKSLGETAGKIPVKPSEEFYKPWHEVIKKKYPEKYQEMSWNEDGVVATGVKQKILNMIFKEVGIKPTHYVHGFNRGVYFAPLYENTREFLSGQITSDKLIPLRKDPTVDAVLEWWRKKAISRYERLHGEGRLKPEKLFYNDILKGDEGWLSWEETKKKYLGDVGR